jgi:hypothetical protein
MEIAEVNKITPGASSVKGTFWKQLGPCLLDPLSLSIIQALLREDQPLSEAEIAARVGAEAGLRELLLSMEIEGILVQGASLHESSEKPEPVFHLREGFEIAPSPSPPRHLADSKPKLSRSARDALFAELAADLGQMSDLERLAESDDPKHIAECEVIGARVVNALRLIQEGGIGWGRTGDSDFVELALDPRELAPLVAHRQQILTAFIELQRAEWERDRRDFTEFVEARDACGTILAQLN